MYTVSRVANDRWELDVLFGSHVVRLLPPTLSESAYPLASKFIPARQIAGLRRGYRRSSATRFSPSRQRMLLLLKLKLPVPSGRISTRISGDFALTGSSFFLGPT